jgi:hypothetical protein
MIITEGGDLNEYAVRIVEPVALSDQAHSACHDATDRKKRFCPMPPEWGLPHFLDPDLSADYFFCRCEEAKGEQDDHSLPAFSLYAEDPDANVDGSPKDTLYGAILLDHDRSSYEDPNQSVDYTSILHPSDPAVLLEGDREDPILYSPLNRPNPFLRSFELVGQSATGQIDLCNDANQTLERGWHTLTIIVTDRQWFQPESGERQDGVPDLAIGATYDTMTYSFFCHSKEEDPACVDQCNIPEDDD